MNVVRLSAALSGVVEDSDEKVDLTISITGFQTSVPSKSTEQISLVPLGECEVGSPIRVRPPSSVAQYVSVLAVYGSKATKLRVQGKASGTNKSQTAGRR